MAYIGTKPLTGEYAKIDPITFNGTNSTFNLYSNGQLIYPQLAQNLIISLNGVLQEPGVAYVTSGSTITFYPTPTAGSTFFGTMLGSVLYTWEGIPSDGQVTTEKLAPTVLDSKLNTQNPTYTGTLTGGTGVVNLGSGQLVKDSSGNLGIGTIPNAWQHGWRALQVGPFGAIANDVVNDGSLQIAHNAYANGTTDWVYGPLGQSSKYSQNGGTHKWFTAPIGTAGTGISFSQVMGLNEHGTLTLTSLVSQTSVFNHSGGAYSTWQHNGTSIGDIGTGNQIISGGSSADFAISSRQGALVLGLNGTEYARIDSTGNFKINYGKYLHGAGFGRFWTQAQTAIGTAQFAGLYGPSITYMAKLDSGWKSMGGGTASALTIDEGILSFSNSQSVGAADVALNWTTRFIVNGQGNVGVGTTPKDWWSTSKAIQISDFVSISQQANGAANFGFNFYESGANTFSYSTSDDACRFSALTTGGFGWYTASAGTAGNTIGFGDAKMSLASDGSLYVSQGITKGRVADYNLWGIDDNLPAVGGQHPYAIHSHTGLALVAHPAYGGVRIFDQNYPSMGGTEIARFTNGTVSITGSINSTGGSDTSGPIRLGIISVGALDIDCNTGNYFTKTINGNSTFTFSNPPASRAYGFTLELTHTSGTVTWPASVIWPNGTAPTLTTGKVHMFFFVTDNTGTTWRGSSAINYAS